MSPDEVIEAYVNDVAQRLPRADRNDVAAELHALLREELKGRAGDGEREDEVLALKLVREFGAPEDVAERYRQPGFVIVPATRSGRFAAFAFFGIALQWLITLPPVLPRILDPGHEFVALGKWWLSQGLVALWWPGFLVTAAIIAGWMRHRWPVGANNWRPNTGNSDHINRHLWALYAALAACGVAAVVGAPWAFEHLLPQAAAAALAFNPDFLAVGGALVVLLWAANAVLAGVVFFDGRWRPLTRRLDFGLQAAWVAVLGWFIAGPAIFLNPPTDQTTKGILALVIAIVLIDVGVKLYRMVRRPQMPADLAGLAKP